MYRGLVSGYPILPEGENERYRRPGTEEFAISVGATMSLLPNLGRLFLTIVFVASFLLRPLQRPIMTLWARIIESDKPVFTLVFGGGAALAKAISEAIKSVG
jgi:hypothetical protein